jgi:hypothetical protein
MLLAKLSYHLKITKVAIDTRLQLSSLISGHSRYFSSFLNLSKGKFGMSMSYIISSFRYCRLKNHMNDFQDSSFPSTAQKQFIVKIETFGGHEKLLINEISHRCILIRSRIIYKIIGLKYYIMFRSTNC